jgi:hypothetical protein
MNRRQLARRIADGPRGRASGFEARDAFQRRVAVELRNFALGCRKNSTPGVLFTLIPTNNRVGVVGSDDSPDYLRLFSMWFAVLNQHGNITVPGTWVSGNYMGVVGAGSEDGMIYGPATPATSGATIDGRAIGAGVLERNWGAGGHLVGAGAAGANASGAQGGTVTSPFSQIWPTTAARGGATPNNPNTWKYPSLASLQFMRKHGMRMVWCPVRWERLVGIAGFPSTTPPTGAGSETESLQAFLTSCASLGILVDVRPWQYGSFWLEDTAATLGRKTMFHHVTAAGTVHLNDVGKLYNFLAQQAVIANTACRSANKYDVVWSLDFEEPVNASGADYTAWAKCGPSPVAGTVIRDSTSDTHWVTGLTKAIDSVNTFNGANTVRVTTTNNAAHNTQINTNLAAAVDAANPCVGLWVRVDPDAVGQWTASPLIKQSPGGTTIFSKIPNSATVDTINLWPGQWCYIFGYHVDLDTGGAGATAVGAQIDIPAGNTGKGFNMGPCRRGPATERGHWHAIQQYLISAVRAGGFTGKILHAGWNWGATQEDGQPDYFWNQANGPTWWIVHDPIPGGSVPNGTHFVDQGSAGSPDLYSTEVAAAVADGF